MFKYLIALVTALLLAQGVSAGPLRVSVKAGDVYGDTIIDYPPQSDPFYASAIYSRFKVLGIQHTPVSTWMTDSEAALGFGTFLLEGADVGFAFRLSLLTTDPLSWSNIPHPENAFVPTFSYNLGDGWITTSDFVVDAESVPEPAALVLLGLGVFSLTLRRRTR